MPLRDDLLNPIPGDNPGGENLRYAPVYDKIKEARREDDNVPQGDWQIERKTADYPLVLKLAGEALATKSKDLQLAVWLAEALTKTESFFGLRAGIDLIRGLIEGFWDNLYPEIEDGDFELRAAPLDWLGSRQDSLLRSLPLTRSKETGWYRFKEARSVGYEADADTSEKQEARAALIADGKMPMEEWDKAFNGSPKSFYTDLEATLDGILEGIDALSGLCEEKYTSDAPSFGPLKSTVEEIRHTVHGLLQKKRETEPDAVAGEEEEAPPPEEAGSEESSSWSEPAPATAATPRKPRPKGGPLAAEPVDKDDAFQRIMGAAMFLRREDPYSATPYLLLRGIRFGELRSAGAEIDPNLLDAPPTEIRQALKRAAMDADWQQVIELAESAMAMPCGRGWLDLQRYVYRAAYELGYYQIQAAIRAEVNALLADYPALRAAIMLDDTPAANPETQAWLDEIAPVLPAAAEQQPIYTPPVYVREEAPPPADGEALPPDANQLAMQAASEGRYQEAIEILMREAAMEKSGRGRFQRRLQLAQLCISIGYEQIAHPILDQITAEIDTRGLEGWETPELVAQPFALLYRCLAKSDANPELKQKIYDRICRLDPLQALACGR
jgi:type VI secretion system protein ImpA